MFMAETAKAALAISFITSASRVHIHGLQVTPRLHARVRLACAQGIKARLLMLGDSIPEWAAGELAALAYACATRCACCSKKCHSH